MAKNVTLRDANQNFAKYVREVEGGHEFVITRRGQPVAKLCPVGAKRILTPAQEAAKRRMLKRLSKGWPLGLGKFNRDEAHER